MATNKQSDQLILNVDDSDGARYAKSRILIRAGFTVIEAASGTAALESARANHPALILLDVKLPDINGMEVCRMLKADPETSASLVLQTSASYIGVADKIKALDGGADNYLFEPIEPEELVANVRALLRLGEVERELRDVDRRKDEFLATLAHELRNPLGPIRNAVELLCRLDPNVDERQDKARRTILRHTEHLVRLVDDLLDVARISQGMITLHEELVELKTFVAGALESVAHSVETRRQKLAAALPEGPVWIRGDHVRLTQIVGNLLHNASKFTPLGGQITLTITANPHAVVIEVADNGIGIEAENMDFIFGLFAQDGFSNDRVQDGLGIGLSLVRTLVGLHGGSVSASSAGLGQGSVFQVRLPRAAKPSADTTADAASVGTKATRVLVVDDNIDSADMLAELLRIEGHEVITAYSGAQALERAGEFAPRIVFLDIGLPDMSGYQVAAKLRLQAAMADAILIALTGYGQERDRELAKEAGFNEHVVKPIDFETVQSMKLHSR